MPVDTNLEKFLSAIICSSFIIVIDKKASGHIAELTKLLELRFRPVIILRDTSRPVTSFLEDRLLTDDYFRVAVISDISASNLIPFIKWAKEKVKKQIENFNRINAWRAQ